MKDSDKMEPQSTTFECLLLQRTVIWALIIKEIKVKFSQGYLSYFGMLMEPLLQAGFFVVLRGFIFRGSSSYGIGYPLVALTGIIPYILFRKVITESFNVVNSTRSMLIHKQVTVFSAIFAKLSIQIFLFFSSFLLVCLGYSIYGSGYPVHNVVLFLVSSFLLFTFTFGISLMMSVLGYYFPELSHFVNLVLRCLFFASGVIFDISMIPFKFQKYLLFNPVFQAISLIRNSFIKYNLPSDSNISLAYLIYASTISLFTGLVVYNIYKNSLKRNARPRI